MSQYVFGTGQLFAMPVGGGAPLRFGALQDVSVDFAGDIKMLYGQYQYPLDSARGKTKIEWKANTGNIDVNAFNTLFFGGTVTTGSELVQDPGENLTVPATVTPATSTALVQVGGVATATFATAHGLIAGQQVVVTGATPAGFNVTAKIISVPTATTLTYAVASGTTTPATIQGTFTGKWAMYVDSAATFYLDLGVHVAATGVPMTQVTGVPTTGQYAVAAGVYTFAAADTGIVTTASYLYYSVATGGSLIINNQLMGTTPRFQLVLNQIYEGNSFTLILYSNVADKLNLPLKQEDYLIADMSGSAFANPAGQIGQMTTTSIAGGGA